MAGTYPDVPGQKLAYDIDGTILTYIDHNSTLTVQANSKMVEMNDYDATIAHTVGTTNGSASHYLCWIFPQPITLRGLWGTVGRQSVGIGSDPSWETQYSSDTTNGQDGTWTVLYGQASTPTWSVHGLQMSDATEPENRTDIKAVSPAITNVKGFRIRQRESNTKDSYIKTVNIYGEHTAPEYLEFWHPTLDQALTGAYFDWGNTTTGTEATKTFRIKNTNPTMQAHDIVLSLNTLATENPSPTTWHTFSDDDVSYSSTLNIGHIPANSISDVLYLKRATPLNAQLQLTELRIVVETTGFG